MVRAGVFIDSSLLVLLVVGRVGRSLITKHHRLREYTGNDYDILVELLRPVEALHHNSHLSANCSSVARILVQGA